MDKEKILERASECAFEIQAGSAGIRVIGIGRLACLLNSLSDGECEWRQWDDWDNSDTWNTGCGQDYCGWEGVPPKEHGVNFCQHCGKKIKWMPLTEDTNG